MSTRKGQYPPKDSSMTVAEINSLPVLGIPDRGITKETAEAFGVRSMYSEVSGKVVAHYFPYTKNGEVVGYKCRDLRAGKGSAGAYTVVGSVSKDCDLFGQKPDRSGVKLWVTEGEYDAMAAYQALYQNQPEKGKHQPNVVSIGFGAGNAAEHVAVNLDYLRKFKDVTFCMDADEKGQQATEELSLLYPQAMVIRYPDRIKDCNDWLKADQKELYWGLMKPVPFEPDNVHLGSISEEELLSPIPTGVSVSVLPRTMSILHGLRPQEMTVVLAPTGVGKSTVCREVVYSLLSAGKKVGSIFLEEDIKKTQQAMIALDNNVWLPKFRAHPDCIPQEAVRASVEKLLNSERSMFVHCGQGHIGPKSLEDKIKYLAMRGAEYVVLDHISYVISGDDADNERKAIDNMLTKLAGLVTVTGVHLIVVAHIKRTGFKAPKDKEGNTKYPYWEEVGIQDARGSGAFEQIAWNIIALEPERLESGERGRVRTRVLKNREWGKLGVGDVLKMHDVTGRLIPAEQEDSDGRP